VAGPLAGSEGTMKLEWQGLATWWLPFVLWVVICVIGLSTVILVGR
jgi:hypothetical protein